MSKPNETLVLECNFESKGLTKAVKKKKSVKPILSVSSAVRISVTQYDMKVFGCCHHLISHCAYSTFVQEQPLTTL